LNESFFFSRIDRKIFNVRFSYHVRFLMQQREKTEEKFGKLRSEQKVTLHRAFIFIFTFPRSLHLILLNSDSEKRTSSSPVTRSSTSSFNLLLTRIAFIIAFTCLVSTYQLSTSCARRDLFVQVLMYDKESSVRVQHLSRSSEKLILQLRKFIP